MALNSKIACGIVENIGKFWFEKKFTDCIINVKDSQFKCHKFMMCACSEFFHVLLRSESKEETNHVTSLTIENISPSIFELILNSLYTGVSGLKAKNMLEYWHVVRELQMPVLVTACEDFIRIHITRENCLDIYKIALVVSSDVITQAIYDFIAAHFSDFNSSQLFQLLPAKALNSIVSSEYFMVESTGHLLEAVLLWVVSSPEPNIPNSTCSRHEDCAPAELVEESQDFSAPVSLHQLQELKTKVTDATVMIPCFIVPSMIHSRNLLQLDDFAAKLQYLKTFLKERNVMEVGSQHLETMIANDLIMSKKETRSIVVDILKQQKSFMEPPNNQGEGALSLALPPAVLEETKGVEETECVMLFQRAADDRICTLCAYSLDQKITFHLHQFALSTLKNNIASCNNQLQIISKHFKPNISDYVWELNMFEFSSNKNTSYEINYFGTDDPFCIIGNFVYKFDGLRLFRRNVCDGALWFKLYDIPGRPRFISLLQSSFFFSVYCVKSKTRSIYIFKSNKEILLCLIQDIKREEHGNSILFICNSTMYILMGNGLLFNVTEHLNSTSKPLSLSNLEQSGSSNQRLWKAMVALYGAVVHKQNLVVFTNVNPTVPCDVSYDNKLLGVKGITFVQLLNVSRCMPLMISSSMLTRSV